MTNCLCMSEAAEIKIIIFDSECGLCNKTVQLIIKYDPNKLFKFTSLQSNYGKLLLHKMGGSTANWNSIILVEGDKYFIKSAAVINILRELHGYSVLYHIIKLFPRIFLDSLYTLIAKTRYKLFGKTDHCEIYQKKEFTERIITESSEMK